MVHSGIYYEPGSLKADLCRHGAEQVKDFASEHAVPLLELGKLVVATTPAELRRMGQLQERASPNGVHVTRLGRDELREQEPEVRGLGALLVPGTAVTDFVAITRALSDPSTRSGECRGPRRGLGGARDRRRRSSSTTTAGDLRAGQVDLLLRAPVRSRGPPGRTEPDFRIVPFRGEYYDVVPDRSDLVSRLIYPVPDPGLPFLGVHLTLTVTGGLTLGPNAVLGLAREGYPKGSFSWQDVRATSPPSLACGRSPEPMPARARVNCATRCGSAGT